MRIRTLILLAMLLSMYHLPLGAVEAVNDGDETVTLSLQDAEIEDLVRWAGQVTNKTIIVHPNVKGRVTVLAGEPMTREEAYQVFLSVLQVHGFSVIDAGDALKVIPAQQAKENDVPLLETGSAGQEDMVVRIVKVTNISAVEVVNLVRPMVPQFAHLAAYPPTNAILIAASAGKIDQIARIVDRLDQVGSIDIELLPLQFASARQVADVVSKLLPGGGQPSQGAEAKGLTIAVDERSNSLLLTGDPVTRQQIKALVQRLDQPLSGDGNTQVIYLQYAKAEDLVPILESVSGSVQKGEKDQRLADVDVNIRANESLNALIITAPPSLQNAMRGVIGKLDVRRAQVLVEALIVEVNEDLANDLGVQWQSNLTPNQESVFAGFSAIPPTVSPLTFDSSTSTVTLGSGLSLGYFRGGTLRAIIQALEGETNANILSTPTILALDNEEAQILVGSSVPFITGSQKREGDNDPFQTIQRQDIGVSLKIKPRINTNNSVTLDIEQKVESIAQSTVQTADIVTNKREIKTRVLIDNDQVLVLGGLIRDEISESESKVPLLGSVPIIGRVFRSTSSTVVKKNLMVFIHPVILRDNRSSNDATRARYEQMRDNQKQFGDRVETYFVPGPLPLLPDWVDAPPPTAVTPGDAQSAVKDSPQAVPVPDAPSTTESGPQP